MCIYIGCREIALIIPEMDSKSAVRGVSGVSVGFVFLILINILITEAQVTFSRDWNAGKRSNVPDCAVGFKSAAAICQMLLNELRAVTTCEMHSLLPSRLAEDLENPQDVFGPQHNG